MDVFITIRPQFLIEIFKAEQTSFRKKFLQVGFPVFAHNSVVIYGFKIYERCNQFAKSLVIKRIWIISNSSEGFQNESISENSQDIGYRKCNVRSIIKDVFAPLKTYLLQDEVVHYVHKNRILGYTNQKLDFSFYKLNRLLISAWRCAKTSFIIEIVNAEICNLKSVHNGGTNILQSVFRTLIK